MINKNLWHSLNLGPPACGRQSWNHCSQQGGGRRDTKKIAVSILSALSFKLYQVKSIVQDLIRAKSAYFSLGKKYVDKVFFTFFKVVEKFSVFRLLLYFRLVSNCKKTKHTYKFWYLVWKSKSTFYKVDNFSSLSTFSRPKVHLRKS